MAKKIVDSSALSSAVARIKEKMIDSESSRICPDLAAPMVLPFHFVKTGAVLSSLIVNSSLGASNDFEIHYLLDQGNFFAYNKSDKKYYSNWPTRPFYRPANSAEKPYDAPVYLQVEEGALYKYDRSSTQFTELMSVGRSLSSAKSYTDSRIADLVNGAPAALDTLKEIADQIQAGSDVHTALTNQLSTLNTAVNNRYTKTESDNRYLKTADISWMTETEARNAVDSAFSSAN